MRMQVWYTANKYAALRGIIVEPASLECLLVERPSIRLIARGFSSTEILELRENE